MYVIKFLSRRIIYKSTSILCILKSKRMFVTFVTNSLLNSHVKIHKLTVHKIQRSSSRKMSDHRKFKCKLCKQKFTEKLDLYKHMSENHQGTNKFKCTQCPRSFSSFERLKNHESIAHENENMYHCSMCTKVFEDFESLEIHQNDKHEMTKENFCGFCNHTFTLKRLFKKHLEKCSKKNSRKNHTKNLRKIVTKSRVEQTPNPN